MRIQYAVQKARQDPIMGPAMGCTISPILHCAIQWAFENQGYLTGSSKGLGKGHIKGYAYWATH